MTFTADLRDPLASFPKATNSRSSLGAANISPLQIRAPAALQRHQPWHAQEPRVFPGYQETAQGGMGTQ